MKNILAVLVLMVAAACSCAGAQQVPQETVVEMLDSTVGVEVHYAGHHVIHHPITDAILEGEPMEFGYIGSGVVYSKTLGFVGPIRSKILTANHVVDGPKVGDIVDRDGEEMRIDSVEYSISTRRGRTCEMKMLKLGPDKELNDVATGLAECNAGTVATIADELPDVGSKIYITGHPAGLAPALLTEGYVSGWTDSGYILTSAPVAGGSSGGPVWYNGQVISILVRVSPAFDHGSYALPLSAVQLRVIESQ